ncbi:glycosyltransferase family 1 protein [Calocera viscosa TUFC12733]|uniref:Glycosyltransferase family 1 protein n=1 Tax=Calocera viscosa (strain TUFC12733) TaxID=1330018 RepID=A0A167IXF3_CALVF|nr:glycosyltransferase family 1 protein [Calocera viscosa TUFC12733]
MPVKEDHPFQLFLWWGGNASSFTRMFGPPDRGGRGGYAEECRKTYEDEKRGDGRSFGDITRDIAIRSSRFPNNIIPVAGLPPYYQWEDWPQEVWHPSLYDALCKCQKLMELADGVLLGTVVDLEPESVKDVMQYMHPKQVLCLGPQFGLAAPSSQGNDLAIKFLDSALVKHGAQSALYISFGSAFFPPAEHVRVLVETLLELDDPMPFVFTASRRRLNPQLMQSIEASGRGLVVSWAPQQAILAHPALGWMISHCGAGGMFESLAEGVPVIAWPFTADQPQHALWLSEVLDSAFELLQIRTGVAQQMKALRGGPEGTTILGTEDAIKQELVDVLTQARGQLGVRKRHNATAAREKLLHAEEAAGSVKKALDELGVELGR